MGDFTQPEQKYAGTGENYNIAIPVIFYPVIKTLWKFVLIIRLCKHSDIEFNHTENNFANMLKPDQKSGNLQDFWTIFIVFAKLIFAFQFRIWVLTHPN